MLNDDAGENVAGAGRRCRCMTISARTEIGRGEAVARCRRIDNRGNRFGGNFEERITTFYATGGVVEFQCNFRVLPVLIQQALPIRAVQQRQVFDRCEHDIGHAQYRRISSPGLIAIAGLADMRGRLPAPTRPG